MNSRQRRQDRKRWRYSIVTVARDFDHYSEMWNWLKVRHGIRICDCGWRDRNNYLDDSVNYRVTWQFIREQDATEFALRWA